MKKRLIFALCLFMSILFIMPIEAASFGMSASTTQVAPNATFTISVGGDCIGRVNLSVQNGTLSATSVWVEQNMQSVTVKAGSSGTVIVTATPTTGFSDADANEYNPGSRSVSVSISSTSTPSRPQTPVVDKRSSNNLLQSLSVSTGSLSPAFHSDITEYNVELPKDASSIVIDAQCQDAKASLDGIGEKQLEAGNNTVELLVTAENGATKTYTLHIYVDETPLVYLPYKNSEIGVVRNLKDMPHLDGFHEMSASYQENPFLYFDNDAMCIIYGVNEDGIKNFYLFDLESMSCQTSLIEMNLDDHFFYLVDDLSEREGFETASLLIHEQEVAGYRFKDGFDDYFLLSVMNTNGEMVDYLYESREETLQLYLGSAPVAYETYRQLVHTSSLYQILTYTFGFLFIVTLGGCLFLLMRFKRRDHHEETH